MTNTNGSDESRGGPQLYEIRVQGRLDARWAGSLEGMAFSPESGGITALTGPLMDQAALHGLLTRIRDLGLPILSFRRTCTANPTNNTGEQHEHHHCSERTS